MVTSVPTGPADPRAALSCPIPASTHPDAGIARSHLNRWVARSGMVRKESARERFERADFARFAAMAYPYTDRAGVCLIADWFAWLFLIDDELDDGVAGTRPDHVHTVTAEIVALLRTPDHADGVAAPTNGAVRA